MNMNAIGLPENRQRFTTFATSPNVSHMPYNKTQKVSKPPSTAVFITTLAGVGCALAHISKKQGFSLKPKSILNSNPKNWAIFKIYNKKNPKTIEIEEPEILELATASVAGGLAGGAIFDKKKHFKAKTREAVNQLLGNVLIPVTCVGAASRLYRKYEPEILKFVPQIPYNPINKLSLNVCKKLSLKNAVKFDKFLHSSIKYTNKFLKIIPPTAVTAVALTTGIITGNRVSNFINEKVFHKKVERKIQKTDFAPHVDDLSMAITLMADKSPISSVIARTIPAFLCIPGLEVGNHR